MAAHRAAEGHRARRSAVTTNDDGAAAVFVAISMVSLLAIAAFAIDVGLLYSERAKLQSAADAAALAAAGDLPDQGAGITAAQSYGAANHPTGGSVVLAGDVTFGYWNGAAETFSPGGYPRNAVEVTAKRADSNGNPIQMWFASIFGKDEADVAASAIAVSAGGTATRFLIDDEMLDTDIPAIEDAADDAGVSSDDLLSDANGDWFIDFYDLAGGITIELPTGQTGDEALFDMDHPAWPFSAGTSHSHLDFLNYNEDGTWRQSLIPSSMLDPLLGVDRVDDPSQYGYYVNPDYLHVSPVYKSDISALDPVGGIPTVNALGERRGLIAFRVMGVGTDPDGPGSALPNLIIKLVNPDDVTLADVVPGSPTLATLVR